MLNSFPLSDEKVNFLSYIDAQFPIEIILIMMLCKVVVMNKIQLALDE